MEQLEREALSARYCEGYSAVREAVASLSEAALDTQPGAGWTPREIVHHLADSEMTATIRLRRLLAEERPVISGYDEELFARKLHYGERPITASLDAVRTARETSAELLDCLSEEEWAREGTHSESGPYTVEDWLKIYAAHAHDHAAQIVTAFQR